MNNTKTICRVKTNENYTHMSNIALRDKRLSWKAKGLMAYMLSNKDGWKFYIEELKDHSSGGKQATKSAFNELGLMGYLSVSIKYDKVLKRFAGRTIIVHEVSTKKRAEDFVTYLNKFKHKSKTNEAVSSHIGNPADIITTNGNNSAFA